jgi:hypothetical protein
MNNGIAEYRSKQSRTACPFAESLQLYTDKNINEWSKIQNIHKRDQHKA